MEEKRELRRKWTLVQFSTVASYMIARGSDLIVPLLIVNHSFQTTPNAASSTCQLGACSSAPSVGPGSGKRKSGELETG